MKKTLFDIDGYVDIYFNVSANEFSILTMKKYDDCKQLKKSK